MNEVETRIREAVGRLAGPAIPLAMPPDVPRRVLRRRLSIVSGLASVVIALAVLTVAVVRLPDHADAPRPLANPYASLPADWPKVIVQPDDQALLAGTVDGIDFRLTAETDADGGPCLLLHLPLAAPSGKGLWTCRSDAESPVPTKADLDLNVIRDDALGDLEANVGFVSARTATLGVLIDGKEQPVPLLAVPEGWNVTPFLFFPPPNVDGWLDALGQDNAALAETQLCGSGRYQMGCFRVGGQIAAIPGSYTPPPDGSFGQPPGEEWTYLEPIVRPTVDGDIAVTQVYGGDFTPYVDLELPSPVIGKKIVVTYGKVGGDPFSLAIYQTNGKWGYNDVGQIELFWGRAWTDTDPGDYGGGSGLGAGMQQGEDLALLVDPRHASDGSRFQVVYGWTSLRVDHVEIRLEDGWTQRVSVSHAGPVDGLGWMMAFVPTAMGAVVPVTADGAELRRWPICVSSGAGEAPTCLTWYHP